MQESIYELRCITPLYGHGYSTKIPEFRLSEVKALVRFTFRAVKGYEDIESLYWEEGNLFGHIAGGKKPTSKDNSEEESKGLASPIRLKLEEKEEKEVKHKLLFHGKREKNPTVSFINIGSKYKVKLITFQKKEENNAKERIEEYEKWLEVSLALFGIGGRARRARGSFSFKSKHLSFESREKFLDSLCQILNTLSGDPEGYSIEDKKMIHIHRNFSINDQELEGDQNQRNRLEKDYPLIESIFLGTNSVRVQENIAEIKAAETLLEKIDTAAHENNSKYTGYAEGKKRYASPVYVSTVELNGKLYPIITMLKIKSDLNAKGNGKDTREDFIKKILNIK